VSALDAKLKRLFGNTMIFTAGKFISKLLVFFMMPLYTACLSEAQYSTADLITQLANLLIPLACLGISEGIFRNAAAKEGDKQAFFSSGVAILGISTLAFLLLSPLLLLLEYFAPYVWLIVLFVLCSNFHSVCAQYVCAIGRTTLFAGQGILNTMLNIGFNLLFLLGFGMKIEGYVLSVVCADFVTTLALIVYCKLWRAFSVKKISKPLMGEMLRFSLPLIPTTVFWWITGVSDRYLVARMRSDTENGLYAAAYKIPTLLTYMVSVFNEAWRLSAVRESDDEGECAAFGYFAYVKKGYRIASFTVKRQLDSVSCILERDENGIGFLRGIFFASVEYADKLGVFLGINRVKQSVISDKITCIYPYLCLTVFNFQDRLIRCGYFGFKIIIKPLIC
jgi:hypothetical protein